VKSRREFLRQSFQLGATLALQPAPGQAQIETVEETGIASLQEKLTLGQLNSVQLLERYLTRIADIDKGGPRVNAVIELNPDAVSIARALDDERKRKGPRGPLHGIPILIKDNIETADKMMTTAGSLALVGPPAAKDAPLVSRLREAGAVILGKTNLSEWANFRSSHSTSGWSGRGGQTLNPYALDRDPSGSSSGSGVAVAASLCAAAVGTETDGSIVSPASVNGVVGIKPTVGLIPGAGMVPVSHRQDTAGPMARTVADAALLLGAMVGASYGRALDPNGLKGARIGVARQMFGFSEDVDRLTESALDTLKNLGAELIDPVKTPAFPKLDQPELEALLWEFKSDLGAYLSARGAAVSSLKDLIEFNERNRDREMPFFGQELMLSAQAKGPLTSREYRSLVSKLGRMARQEGIDRVIAEHKLEALVAPTGGPAWPIDYPNGDRYSGGASTPAAVAGYPHITVPAGFVQGLPVGLSFFGSPRTESKLIRYAFSFEQAARARRPPQFLPTVKLR
jgi:amidase